MEKITLNPEIKKQMKVLFELLEQEDEKHHTEHLAEAMAEEFGEYMKTHRGYFLLKYAHDISQTESEKAVCSLEEAFYLMDDEAAAIVTNLVVSSLKLNDFWKQLKNGKEGSDHRVETWFKELATAAKKADVVLYLWEYRAQGYREEIEKLKKTSCKPTRI